MSRNPCLGVDIRRDVSVSVEEDPSGADGVRECEFVCVCWDNRASLRDCYSKTEGEVEIRLCRNTGLLFQTGQL